MLTPEVKKRATFKTDLGITILEKADGCCFCKHSTDLWIDFSHGCWMAFCEKQNGFTSVEGIYKDCRFFEKSSPKSVRTKTLDFDGERIDYEENE